MAFDPKREAKKFIDVEIEAPRRGPGRPRKPVVEPAKPAMPLGSTPNYYRYGTDDASENRIHAAEELFVIKEAVTAMFAGRLMGNGSYPFNAEQERSFRDADTRLKKALADWKAEFGSRGVDTETILRDTFTSTRGRTWELVPDCHRQAREWALGSVA